MLTTCHSVGEEERSAMEMELEDKAAHGRRSGCVAPTPRPCTRAMRLAGCKSTMYYIAFESVVLVGLASAAARDWSSIHVASSLEPDHGAQEPVGLVGVSVRSTTTSESSVGTGIDAPQPCPSLRLTAHPLSQPRLNIPSVFGGPCPPSTPTLDIDYRRPLSSSSAR